MSNWKLKLFGLTLLDFSILAVLVLTIGLNGNALLDSAQDVRTSLNNFDQIQTEEYDYQDSEDLRRLNATLSQDNGLKDSTSAFILVLLRVFFIVALYAAFAKALELYVLSNKKGKNYYLLLVMWAFVLHLVVLLFSGLYWMLASSITGKLQIYSTSMIFGLAIAWIIICSYLLMVGYAKIVNKIQKKKLTFGKWFKIHTIWLIVLAFYMLVAQNAQLFLYNESLAGNITVPMYGLLLLILVLVAHFIVIWEEKKLLEA